MTKIPVLFQLMDESGITAKALSAATGISTGNISDWKSGRSKPSSEKLTLLANFFHVSVDYLLGNDESKPDARKAEAVTDEDLKFALFNGTDGITDAMYEEVKQFAQMVKMREEAKNKGE